MYPASPGSGTASTTDTQHAHVHAMHMCMHMSMYRSAHMQTETHVSCNCRSAATRTRHPICAPRTDARAPLIPSAFRPLCMRARFIARDESCAPLDTAHVGFGLGFAIDARTSSRIESGKTSRASCQPSRGEPPSWASGASTCRRERAGGGRDGAKGGEATLCAPRPHAQSRSGRRGRSLLEAAAGRALGREGRCTLGA